MKTPTRRSLAIDEVPGNICLDYQYGDSAKVADAFAKAAHVTRLRLISNRIVVCAMEPRSAIGHYDAASDRYTLHAGCQGVFGLKHQMADLLQIKPAQMRVLRSEEHTSELQSPCNLVCRL